MGFAPFQQNHALMVDRTMFPKVPTSAYGKKIPKDYEEAMRTIAPETVIEKVLEII